MVKKGEKKASIESRSAAEQGSHKGSFWQVAKEYLFSILGGVIYAAALNLFIFPLGLYIGNLTGIAQIIQDLLKLFIPGLKDILGYLVIALNIPLFILSFASINRRFFLKTVLTVLATSLAFQFIPVRLLIRGITEPVTYVLIGAVLAGFGIGLSLQNKGSSGGVDILGVYLSLKRKGFSIGKVGILIAAIVYTYAFFKISPAILVYSVLFTLVSSFIIDRMHFQNIKEHVTIISKDKEILGIIKHETGRSATYWTGSGAYSNTESYVVLTVLSKYEVERVRNRIMQADPNAFFIESGNVHVSGNFPAHFFD
ncbi:MAG: YitT family protein [Anaerolineaceae bacterium]|nr:YitT family protein [Anaerolineaceae bacterium]